MIVTQRIARSARGPSVRTYDFRRCDKQLPWPWTITGGGNGTRVNSAGAIETIAANNPRFDYDPVTLQPRGLLVEEQRTNLLLQSAAFDNASWSKTSSTITANAILSPDGTLTADKLVESAVNAAHYVSQVYGAAADNTTYTSSCFLKAGERSGVEVSLQNKAGTFITAVVNLLTGAVTPSVHPELATWSCVSYGNGWWRVSATVNSSAGATTFLPLRVFLVSSSAYLGDGASGVYLWGAQLEVGSVATSYIPTAAATATRAIEQVTCASLAQLGFNTVGFTFSIGWEHGSLASAAAWPNPIIFRDAGGANRLQLFFDNTNQLSIRVDSGSATIDQRVVATGIVPTKHRAVVAVSPTGISVSVDGGAVTTYSVAVPLAAFTAVDLGGNAGAANNALNGVVRDYKDWPRLLSSDELIAEAAVI